MGTELDRELSGGYQASYRNLTGPERELRNDACPSHIGPHGLRARVLAQGLGAEQQRLLPEREVVGAEPHLRWAAGAVADRLLPDTLGNIDADGDAVCCVEAGEVREAVASGLERRTCTIREVQANRCAFDRGVDELLEEVITAVVDECSSQQSIGASRDRWRRWGGCGRRCSGGRWRRARGVGWLSRDGR